MHIALDARSLCGCHQTGPGRYLAHLYCHLAQRRPNWRVNAYVRKRGSLDNNPLPEPFSKLCCIDTPGTLFDSWTRSRLPLAVWTDGADLMHCPDGHCPTWMPVPTVVTIHDLHRLDQSGQYPPNQVQHFSRSLHCACHRAAAIICPSTHLRDRLIAERNVPSTRITVIPWGTEAPATAPDARIANALHQQYGLEAKFVVCFSKPAAYTHTAHVLEAWSVIPSALRQNRQLLILGMNDQTQERFTQTATSLGILSSIRLHGQAAKRDLALILSLAEILIYPNPSAGSGLPILKAFAADTPVMTSDHTATSELAANAAILIHPENPVAMANAIQRLLTDNMLRKRGVQRGRRYAEAFDWAQIAETFAQTLESTANLARSNRVAA